MRTSNRRNDFGAVFGALPMAGANAEAKDARIQALEARLQSLEELLIRGQPVGSR